MRGLQTISPTLICAIFIVLGLLMDRVFNLPGLPLPPAAHWIGLALSALGVALIIISIGLFRVAPENAVDELESSVAAGMPLHSNDKIKIHPRGPYRYSRNPIYLGLSMIHLGIALTHFSSGMLFFIPVSFALINFMVVRREEAHFLQLYGHSYSQYCRRVRRWL